MDLSNISIGDIMLLIGKFSAACAIFYVVGVVTLFIGTMIYAIFKEEDPNFKRHVCRQCRVETIHWLNKCCKCHIMATLNTKEG